MEVAIVQLWRDVVMATELVLKQRGQGGSRKAPAPSSSLSGDPSRGGLLLAECRKEEGR